jgi:heptosyltransferase I
VLPALRRAYPAARICWLTEELGARVLEGNPQIDALYVLPRKKLRALRRAGNLVGWWKEVR